MGSGDYMSVSVVKFQLTASEYGNVFSGTEKPGERVLM